MNDSYFNSEEFQEIFQRYEEAEQEGRAAYFDSDALADIAEYYYGDGRTNEAVNAALKGVDMFPGAMAPLVFMGRYELLKQNNPEKATWYVDQIDDQSEAECVYLRAEIKLVEMKPTSFYAINWNGKTKRKETTLFSMWPTCTWITT